MTILYIMYVYAHCATLDRMSPQTYSVIKYAQHYQERLLVSTYNYIHPFLMSVRACVCVQLTLCSVACWPPLPDKYRERLSARYVGSLARAGPV